MKHSKLLALTILIIASSSFIWIPAIVFAVTDNMDKYNYYLSALEHILLVHAETLRQIINLFSEAVYGA